jgi:hypothetical protein
MINLRRLDVIRIFALSALLLTPAAISWAQQRPAIADKMAKAHGLDSFGQVEGIRYTLQCGTSRRQRFPHLGMEPEGENRTAHFPDRR